MLGFKLICMISQYFDSDIFLIEPGDNLGSKGVVTKSKDFGFDSS